MNPAQGSGRSGLAGPMPPVERWINAMAGGAIKATLYAQALCSIYANIDGRKLRL
jgi:hypothetical protein